MVMTPPLIDVDQAQITRAANGTVTVDDPSCPLLVTVRLDPTRRINTLSIAVRHPTGRINTAALARLPLAQISHVAAAAATAISPDEAHYRALAVPRPIGQRTWDAGHWTRVLTVYEWAETTGRPGGGRQAVADMWGVTRDPTVKRWLAYARARNRNHPPRVD